MCEKHDQNTADLSSLKSSLSTIKWLISLGMPILCLILGAWIGGSYDTIKTSIEKMDSSVSIIEETTNAMAIRMASNTATTQEQISQTRRDIDNLNYRIQTLHGPGSSAISRDRRIDSTR